MRIYIMCIMWCGAIFSSEYSYMNKESFQETMKNFTSVKYPPKSLTAMYALCQEFAYNPQDFLQLAYANEYTMMKLFTECSHNGNAYCKVCGNLCIQFTHKKDLLQHAITHDEIKMKLTPLVFCCADHPLYFYSKKTVNSIYACKNSFSYAVDGGDQPEFLYERSGDFWYCASNYFGIGRCLKLFQQN